MNAELLLVVGLSVASTLSAGLAAGRAPPGGSTTRPRAWLAIIAANVIGLPLLAWCVSAAVGQGAAAAGIIVAAAAPGGSTGPLLAVVAGGDAALAGRLFLALTGLGTAGGLVAAVAFQSVRLPDVARAVLIVVVSAVIPLLAGWRFAIRRPRLAALAGPWLSRASVALLIATIALLAARHADQASAQDLGVASVIVLASLALGAAVRPRQRAIAVAQVSAVRNLTMALLILAGLGGPPEATSAVLAYGLVMYLGAGALAVAARRRGTPPAIGEVAP